MTKKLVDTAGHHAEKKTGNPIKRGPCFLFAKDIEECQTEAELRKLVEKKPNFVMETQTCVGFEQ